MAKEERESAIRRASMSSAALQASLAASPAVMASRAQYQTPESVGQAKPSRAAPAPPQTAQQPAQPQSLSQPQPQPQQPHHVAQQPQPQQHQHQHQSPQAPQVQLSQPHRGEAVMEQPTLDAVADAHQFMCVPLCACSRVPANLTALFVFLFHRVSDQQHEEEELAADQLAEEWVAEQRPRRKIRIVEDQDAISDMDQVQSMDNLGLDAGSCFVPTPLS